jgi:TPR repeat protein
VRLNFLSFILSMNSSYFLVGIASFKRISVVFLRWWNGLALSRRSLAPQGGAATLLVFLGGCAGLPQAGEPTQQEVKALFEQPNIDPLTHYLERHGARRSASTDRVRAERDKRCTVLADNYAPKEKTAANLEKLEKRYRYSCPAVVLAFADQVNRSGAEAKPGETTPEGALATAAQASSTPSALSDKDKASIEKCYLPFAIKNYREAHGACAGPAAMGDARAQYNLGYSARALKLYPEAVKWTQRAQAQGLPEAQLHLGLLYQLGQGLPLSLTKAVQQFELAAAQGLAEAQYMAGLMYYRGNGVKRDYALALRWFTKAATQGHDKAQLHLGRMYIQGEGVAINKEKGCTWLLAAAEQRVAEAQYQLGLFYAQNSKTVADNVQAYIWLSLAVASGSNEAAAPRDKIASKLSPEQLANAQQRSRRAQEGMH